jgi:hypothetical protein
MILPKLTLKDLATYHNSQGHNCCLEMLEVGYHRSFQVLHNIIRIQRKKQEEADPGSGIWRQVGDGQRRGVLLPLAVDIS